MHREGSRNERKQFLDFGKLPHNGEEVFEDEEGTLLAGPLKRRKMATTAG